MITKDGENLIKKVLLSVLPYCEECIVYDTGSTDGTLEILGELANKFSHLHCTEVGEKTPKELTAILNRMKNESKGDWILRVDDDEVFPKETMEEIRNVDGQVPVYSIPFLHYEDGHFINPLAHSPKRPGFFVARLFKNLPDMSWVNGWGSEVIHYGGHVISSRAFQVTFCKKLKNPFLHLGEMREGKRKHGYRFHQKGHCSMPLGEYAKYIL